MRFTLAKWWLGVAVTACIVEGAQRMRVHQMTDFGGHVVTNAGVLHAVTGVFSFVPAAAANEPVPFWQMTNYVNRTGTNYLWTSGGNAMMGALNAGGWPVTNVAEPTAAHHAATKGYVDRLIFSNVVSLVSGECDTNVVEILFSTNYYITGVSVYQPAPVPQRSVFVYISGTEVYSFEFGGTTETRVFDPPLELSKYDRLGIAVTQTNSTIQFCFEGTLR